MPCLKSAGLTSVCPFVPFDFENLVGTSSMKSQTQNEVLTNFDCVVSSQLNERLFSSRGMFRKASDPSSVFVFSPVAILHFIYLTILFRPSAAILGGRQRAWACYAVAGIKQRREPKAACVSEGARFELAQARPALAPSDARPPNKSPRSVSVVGMFV